MVSKIHEGVWRSLDTMMEVAFS